MAIVIPRLDVFVLNQFIDRRAALLDGEVLKLLGNVRLRAIGPKRIVFEVLTGLFVEADPEDHSFKYDCGIHTDFRSDFYIKVVFHASCPFPVLYLGQGSVILELLNDLPQDMPANLSIVGGSFYV